MLEANDALAAILGHRVLVHAKPRRFGTRRGVMMRLKGGAAHAFFAKMTIALRAGYNAAMVRSDGL